MIAPLPSLQSTSFDQTLRHLGPGPLALDLETYSVNYPQSDEALEPTQGEIRLLSLCSENGNPQLIDHMRWPVPAEQLAALLDGRTVIVHNAPFDCAWLKAKFGIRPCRVFDTLVAERLITNGLGVSNKLGPTLERELGLSVPKELGASDWGGLFLTPAQGLYAANDVRYLHRLMAEQIERLQRDGLKDVFDLEIALLPVVAHMEASGFQVDKVVLASVERESSQQTGAIGMRILSRLAPGEKLNLNSSDQLKSALATIGISLPNTEEVALAALDDPIGALLLKYRGWEMQRRQAAALQKAIAPDGRIYARFNPLGARSGRFSSNGPNLQQINKRGAMRTAFCAAPGYTLIILDFSQIELRAAALISGDEAMINALSNGEDLHEQTASIVLSKPPKEVDKQDRHAAKPVNFGFLYGQQAAGLVEYARAQYGVRFTLNQAEKIRHKFFAYYKGLARWHAKARLHAPFVLEGRTSLGRRRLPPPDASDWDKFQLVTNFPVQGGMADGLKKSLVRLYNELPADVRLICCVHDEAILEAPAGLAEEVRAWAQQVMVEEMATLLPGVPVEVGSRVCANWGEKS